jgi:hypothetical protein
VDEPLVVMGDPRVHGGKADRQREQRSAEHRHGSPGRFAAVPEVLGDDRRREGISVIHISRLRLSRRSLPSTSFT